MFNIKSIHTNNKKKDAQIGEYGKVNGQQDGFEGWKFKGGGKVEDLHRV